MISTAGIVAALKAGGTPFKFVGGAIDLTTAGEHLKIFPAAYVLPLQDAAGGNRLAAGNAVSQLLSERFGVMIAVRNVRAGAGDKVQDDLRTAIDWTRTQLVGYQIDAAHDLVELEGGDVVNFENEIGIWIERYRTTRDLRKV